MYLVGNYSQSLIMNGPTVAILHFLGHLFYQLTSSFDYNSHCSICPIDSNLSSWQVILPIVAFQLCCLFWRFVCFNWDLFLVISIVYLYYLVISDSFKDLSLESLQASFNYFSSLFRMVAFLMIAWVLWNPEKFLIDGSLVVSEFYYKL